MFTFAYLPGLQGCSTSVQIITDGTVLMWEVGMVGSGTAYVGVEFSPSVTDSRKETSDLTNSLVESIARMLRSVFRQCRSMSDIASVEPDSAGVAVIVRAQQPTLPMSRNDTSRGWIRLLGVAIATELYNKFSLDLPAYRNNVALPFAGVSLRAFELLYSSHYELAGDYGREYQLSVLKPDESLRARAYLHILRRSRCKRRDKQQAEDLGSHECSKGNHFEYREKLRRGRPHDDQGLGEDLRRAYPNDRNRLLSFKRSIFRIVDDTLAPSPTP